MRHSCLFAMAAVLCLLFASSPGVYAADGAIPIWEPTTITEPGSYVVTRDITAADGLVIISIESNDVDLDLNGHTLTATSASGGGVRAYDVAGPKARNGKIFCEEGWAVDFVNVEGFEVQETEARSTDDETFHIVGTKGVIEDNEIVFSQDGIWLDGSDMILRNNIVHSGIRTHGTRMRLVGNVAYDIEISQSYNQIIDNISNLIWLKGL